MRLIIDDQVTESARRTAAAIPTARRTLLTRLAAHLERGAIERASGGGNAAPGDYPIPIRTGHFRRSFGMQVGLSHALVFNTSVYARAIHDGFHPYGNTRAERIAGRKYFDDALDAMDVPAIVETWEDSLPWR